MAIPDLIPISYEPDYHTDMIGRWAGGQFLGGVVAAFPKGYTHTDDWPRHKRWYAVLHTFDAKGRYLDSRIQSTGTEASHLESVSTAKELVRKWLESLPRFEFCDIAIQLFEVDFDQVRFGLILEYNEDEEWVELYPDGIGFYEPWDGSYDT